jgi:hypothetical protein
VHVDADFVADLELPWGLGWFFFPARRDCTTECVGYRYALPLTLSTRVMDFAHSMLCCGTRHLMKHFIGVAVLVTLALAVRFWAFPRSSLDCYGVHATYFVISLRTITFWFLIGTAAVWCVIAWKSGRV